MWWGLLLIGLIFYLRYNRSTYELNCFGIQVLDYIYGPTHDLHQKSPWWFDLVLIGKYNDSLHLYRLLHNDYSVIKLTHVPVMYKLAHIVEGQEKSHSYYPGSPFSVRRGGLVLSERKRKGLGFSLQVVAQSESWPMEDHIAK